MLNAVSGTRIGGASASGNLIVGKSPTPAIRDIAASGGATTIQGNYIGLNASGDAPLGYSGITLSSNGNQIGGSGAGAGNVIAGNADSLIAISGTDNRVEGNLIGLDAAGANVLASGTGIDISGTSNVVGGATAPSRNVVAAKILVRGSAYILQGNFVGLDAGGNVSLPLPVATGIELSGANGCLLGGSDSRARNVIAGSVHIFDCMNIRVEGNYIGTTTSGVAASGNGGIQVDTADARFRTASGNALIANVIACPAGGAAVELDGATDTVIADNKIGVGADGSSALGDGGFGIYVTHSLVHPAPSYRTTIRNNTIAHAARGIYIDAGYNTQLTANSIYANRGVGIDLAGFGAGDEVTPNDVGDSDAGSNNVQNYPVTESVTYKKDGTVTLTGTLNSVANSSYRLEFFGNDVVNPSGHGEGQYYLGSTDVLTDTAGNASFSLSFAVPASVRSISATATDSAGNTSEFSAGQGQLLNISTRAHVGTGDNAVIGGFIVTGADAKRVLLRGLGPSLASSGVADVLADPTLQLFDSAGTEVAFNDDWRNTEEEEIAATGIPPDNDKEAAIVRDLDPGAYTAVLRGNDETTGNGLVEVYDLDQPAAARLANISTRAFVGTGDNLLIGGFIVGPTGSGSAGLLLRALGPSLIGIAKPLQDPLLEVRDASGALLARNDDWKENQEAIEATGAPPANEKESALLRALPPGNYTVIVRSKDDSTGTALVEIYNLQ